MAAPVINSFVADKQTAAPRDVVTFTMNYSDPDTRILNFVGTLVDGEGNAAQPATVTVAVRDQETPAVQSDSTPPIVATKVSDDGTVAVFRATIPG